MRISGRQPWYTWIISDRDKFVGRNSVLECLPAYVRQSRLDSIHILTLWGRVRGTGFRLIGIFTQPLYTYTHTHTLLSLSAYTRRHGSILCVCVCDLYNVIMELPRSVYTYILLEHHQSPLLKSKNLLFLYSCATKSINLYRIQNPMSLDENIYYIYNHIYEWNAYTLLLLARGTHIRLDFRI